MNRCRLAAWYKCSNPVDTDSVVTDDEKLCFVGRARVAFGLCVVIADDVVN